MGLKEVIRMNAKVNNFEWMSFWIVGTRCHQPATWGGTSLMPFDGIHIDLTKQTLCSPYFSLLKLAVNTTKKRVQFDKTTICCWWKLAQSPVCYWGAVCGPLVWLTWLPGAVRPLLPPRPPLRSIPLRAELHLLYLPAPPHSCLPSDHRDAKGRDILYHYLHRIPKIESELGRR